MKVAVGQTSLEVVRGDITKQQVDVIVNAANSALAGGGGVDAAIHRAGGPSILAECRTFKGGCPPGQAVITKAGLLPAKRVIHAVGPVWYGGHKGEEDLLTSVYRISLELAQKEELRSIAFPSISTGAYRFPMDRATEIALGTTHQFVTDNPGVLDRVRFVVFSERDEKIYFKGLSSVGA